MDSFLKNKTIASIVTPLGEGGIGKIIVSGQDALGVVNKLFAGKGIDALRKASSHKLYYGHIHDKGQRIDEVILNVTKKADSFTGEDMVEVNCHGGIRVAMRIYECLQSSGAEGVEWNSLLLQSFENNKIDFIQKEALQEIVKAHTKLSVKILLDQYAGALSDTLRQGLEIIEGIRQSLSSEVSYQKNEIAHTHQSLPPSRWKETDAQPLDIFPSPSGMGLERGGDNSDVPFSTMANLIGSLLKTASLGIALTTPQVLVILGKPNVGKSTLINAILGEERMLVHHEPGTTRDYVSEFISVEGIPFELIDTAGMRDTSDALESMSIEMTQEQLQRADKVIAVFDNSRFFDQEDKGVLSALDKWLITKDYSGLKQKADICKVIPVVNKCDLPAKLDVKMVESGIGQSVCRISALNKNGLEDLNRRLVENFDTAYKPMMPVLFSKRQYSLLSKADDLIKENKHHLTTKKVSAKALQIINELKDIFMMCLKGNDSPPRKGTEYH